MDEAHTVVAELTEAVKRFVGFALAQQDNELLQRIHEATASGSKLRLEVDAFGLGQRRIGLVMIEPGGARREVTHVAVTLPKAEH